MIAPVQSRTGSALSYTQLSTFQRCPLKWQFQYRLKLPRERVNLSLAFGSAVHSALEAHFRAWLTGIPGLDLGELLVAFGQGWKRETVNSPLEIDEHAGDLHVQAERMLAAFLGSPQAIPDGEILGVEEELRQELLPGLPEFTARVDLLLRTDAALVVRDFKSARSRWSTLQLAESAPQLLLYGELATRLAEEFGDLPLRLEFVVVTKTQKPVVEVHPVEIDPLAVGRLRRTIARLWEAMEAGVVYPCPSAMNCGSCPFPKACAAWRG